MLLMILSDPFYRDPFGLWLGEEHQRVTSQNRPLIGYLCRHFHFPKHYLIRSQVQPLHYIAMRLWTLTDHNKSAPTLSNGHYTINFWTLCGLSVSTESETKLFNKQTNKQTHHSAPKAIAGIQQMERFKYTNRINLFKMFYPAFCKSRAWIWDMSNFLITPFSLYHTHHTTSSQPVANPNTSHQE